MGSCKDQVPWLFKPRRPAHSRLKGHAFKSWLTVLTPMCVVGMTEQGIVYDEPTMRPLPVAPVVVVKAQMGAGKTKALRDLCAADKGSTALLVTFSRALAAKLVKDFSDFADYASAGGVIDADRVVVCLDSLHRIKRDAFDYLIIDEAVSVFLHYNSPLMKQASVNVARMDALMKTSCSVYFVDAAVDLPFMTRIVEHVCAARGCDPVRVTNRFVRHTNRKYEIYDKPRGRAAHDVICAAVRAGDKVVVCSSTKSFVLELEEHAALRCPMARVVTHYGGGSGNKRKGGATVFEEPLKDVDDIWSKADLLIYSPAVSAGVSFELPHFDRLFANFVNCAFTPGVEVSLQQLFRVRQLGVGDMTIFYSTFGGRSKQPESVDDPEFHGLHPRLKGSLDHRTPLGRLVAQGVLDMRKRSAERYLQVLTETLEDGHGVRAR
jgi:Origin of replication binding protein